MLVIIYSGKINAGEPKVPPAPPSFLKIFWVFDEQS
jgi:hypothetical protein